MKRLLFSVFCALALAASAHASQGASRGAERLIREIRHEIVTLPYYEVFDNLAFQVEGGKVTLLGQVMRPTLNTNAERVAVYRAIFGHNNLYRYAMRSVPPIRILVKNGNLTLEGVVANEADKNVAGIQANGVSGVFSVTNNLRVEK